MQKERVDHLNNIISRLSRDTLAAIEFIRLSDDERYEVATGVAAELLVYALYKTGSEVADIGPFMMHMDDMVTEIYYDFLAKQAARDVK